MCSWMMAHLWRRQQFPQSLRVARDQVCNHEYSCAQRPVLRNPRATPPKRQNPDAANSTTAQSSSDLVVQIFSYCQQETGLIPRCQTKQLFAQGAEACWFRPRLRVHLTRHPAPVSSEASVTPASCRAVGRLIAAIDNRRAWRSRCWLERTSGAAGQSWHA